MKRILFVLALMISATAMMAKMQHFSFKGIPIDGTLNEYTNNLLRTGCTRIGEMQPGMSVLQGEVAGFKNCIIYVRTPQSYDRVCKVYVKLTENKEHNQLAEDFSIVKNLLDEKYGTPKYYNGCDYNTDKSDDVVYDHKQTRMMGVTIGSILTRCYTYSTDLGCIRLFYSNNREYEGGAFLLLEYVDYNNTKFVRKAVIGEL